MMSRIGNRILTIPSGTTVTINNNLITVKGPKGELSLNIPKGITVKEENNTILVERSSDIKQLKQLHGTINALISNMLEGVNNEFKKDLEIIGVGYRFQQRGNILVINAGFSHSVEMEIPKGIKVDIISNTEISIHGIDKESVGEFAANVRKVKEPEPYKGKGIRYKDEHVRRKEGKKAA
jgi:large subunit ribosomal protein L6